MNSMGWCNSYSAALKKNKKFAEGFDSDTKSWKAVAENFLSLKDEVQQEVGKDTSTIDTDIFQSSTDMLENKIQTLFEKYGGEELREQLLLETSQTNDMQMATSSLLQRLEPIPYQVCISNKFIENYIDMSANV